MTNPNEFIGQRVAVLEQIVGENKKDIEKLQDTTTILSELKVIAKQNSTQMERQIETNNEQTRTLDKINTNLTKLNDDMTILNDRVDTIENKGKFDLVKFLTQDALKIILIGLLIAFFALIGLKL